MEGKGCVHTLCFAILVIFVAWQCGSVDSTTPPSVAASTTSPSGGFLETLLRLENALNGTTFCNRRMRNLWKDIADREERVKSMQDTMFRAADQLAKLQFNRPIEKECPSPFTKSEAGCLYCNMNVTVRRWSDARRACLMLGGDLAYPSDISAFHHWARGHLTQDLGFFFVGARADSYHRNLAHRFFDGRLVMSQSNYYSILHVPTESFVCTVYDNIGFKFKAKSCDSFKRWFICEIKTIE